MENTTDKMNIFKTLLKRIVVVIITMLALVCILFAFIYHEQRKESLLNSELGKLTNLAVSNLVPNKNTTANRQTINWWYNEKDTRYYLFLPSTADSGQLRIELTGVDKIYIDGKSVQNYEKVSLSVGEQHVITTADYNDDYFVLMLVQSKNLPAMYVSTESGSFNFIHEVKGNEEPGKLLLIDAEGTVKYDGVLSGVRGRGNATWGMSDEKGYQIKLANKSDLLGMGSAKRWVLLANEQDGTKLRNYIVYELAKKMGLAYTPEGRFVDCYFNGVYNGSYFLSEKNEIDEERINITNLEEKTQNLNPEKSLEKYPTFGDMTDTNLNNAFGYDIPNNPSDITGGYLLEFELPQRQGVSPAGFITSHNQLITVKKPSHPSKEQVSYIQEQYQKMEDAIFNSEGLNPDTGRSYTEYIDMDSFTKKYLVEEISKNQDAMLCSCYFYKDIDSRSDKIYAGPIWDYDIAFGNYRSDAVDLAPQGLYASSNVNGHNIWHELYRKEEFYQAVVNDYQTLARPAMVEILEQDIDSKAIEIFDSVTMNQLRWYDGYGDIEGYRTWYINEIQSLKQYIINRIVYLDTEWK